MAEEESGFESTTGSTTGKYNYIIIFSCRYEYVVVYNMLWALDLPK